MDNAGGAFHNMNVLVTGGTQGLGKAIGLEFASRGASTFLTFRWGSANEDALRSEFRNRGAVEPHIVESDASDPQAIRELMSQIKQESGRLDVIVSNVSFAQIVKDMSDLRKSTLDLSLNHSAWPLIEMVKTAHEIIGSYPRYVVAISSGGVEVCYEGYDFVGMSKAVLETMCRYLALHLKRHGVRVNAIRPGFLDTASLRATFGEDFVNSIQDRMSEFFLDPQSVAQACLALCSGMMDAVTGQVIVVDEGWSLVSPTAFITGHGLPGSFPGKEAERK